MCGHVEQQDVHLPTLALGEALQFSALLRLLRKVTASAQREAFVNGVRDILELTYWS